MTCPKCGSNMFLCACAKIAATARKERDNARSAIRTHARAIACVLRLVLILVAIK